MNGRPNQEPSRQPPCRARGGFVLLSGHRSRRAFLCSGYNIVEANRHPADGMAE
jgi:hypothetical protein